MNHHDKRQVKKIFQISWLHRFVLSIATWTNFFWLAVFEICLNSTPPSQKKIPVSLSQWMEAKDATKKIAMVRFGSKFWDFVLLSSKKTPLFGILALKTITCKHLTAQFCEIYFFVCVNNSFLQMKHILHIFWHAPTGKQLRLTYSVCLN